MLAKETNDERVAGSSWRRWTCSECDGKVRGYECMKGRAKWFDEMRDELPVAETNDVMAKPMDG